MDHTTPAVGTPFLECGLSKPHRHGIEVEGFSFTKRTGVARFNRVRRPFLLRVEQSEATEVGFEAVSRP